MLRITAPLFIAALLAAPLSAQATVEKTFSWAFSTTSGTGTRCIDPDGNLTTNNGCNSDFDGNIYNFRTSTGNTYENNVSVAGFSTTNDLKIASGVTKSVSEDFSTNTTADGFETATVKMWDGLGVSSREDDATNTVPHHAMDNDGGSTGTDETADSGDVDAALFSFDQAISLTAITIGWTNSSYDETGSGTTANPIRKNDADISVLRYTGAGAPPVIATNDTSSATINNKNFASLLNEGWEFVGHYANLNSKTANNGNGLNTINTNGKTSSYWLISAFTAFADLAYNNATTEGRAVLDSVNTATGLDFGNDYFKIAGLGATTLTPPPSNQVPEPASLVLLALGLIGWRVSRNNQSSPNLADSTLSTVGIAA